MTADTRKMERMFTPPVVEVERRPDGTQVLRSGIPFPETYARCVGDWFEHWATAAPDRLFLAERDRDGKHRLPDAPGGRRRGAGAALDRTAGHAYCQAELRA